MINIALTGHRPPKLWGYDMTKKEYTDLQLELESLIMRAIKDDDVTCHSGMALGADTVWAKAIINAKQTYVDRITFVAHVPCKGQESRWPKTSQDTFQKLLTEADNIVYYSDKYTPQCMQLRNIGMINECDILIAVTNGDEIGGTANAIAYAKKKNKPIHTIQIK